MFKADLFCPECGWEMVRDHVWNGLFPPYWTMEETWKVIFARGDAEAAGVDVNSADWPVWVNPELTDFPEHCGSRESCRNAIHLADGRRGGCLLPITLTEHGREYVRQALGTGTVDPVPASLWRGLLD